MQIRLTAASCLSLLALLAAFAAPCRAATVTIAPSGSGVYEVSGSEFSSVAGLELQIAYDGASLSGPVIAWGGLVAGALMDSDVSGIGNIRMAVITTRPISGSGAIATITFRLKSGAAGGIRSMTANLIDKNGARLDSRVRINDPAGSKGPVAGSDSGAAASTAVVLHSGSAAAGGGARPGTESVVQKFRGFRGNGTREEYVALFSRPEHAECRQEPPVCLSDGNSTARLIFDGPGNGGASPNFAFSGARVVSMRRGGGSSWIVEVRPEKGVNQATVTVLVDNVPKKCPVTVAQPLEMLGGSGGLKPDEKGFAVFLQQRGTEKSPLYDLNRDGKRDYLDDYIFTANYLAAAEKVAGREKPAPK